ncbi:hypothetical protein [Paraburkholderia tropica]|uniref:hypothetical protein n=1 Tax=Paraburkholderia tropica TaxID=92647 RepID=UPI001591FE43|nr:hypothetical protein [Paraburkholderia tropica]
MSSSLKSIVNAQLRAFNEPIAELFQIPHGHLIEAVSSGFGARTYAALRGRYEQQPLDPLSFDRQACIERLSELTDPVTAAAVDVLVGGARLTIKITRRAVQPARYLDIAYDVEAALSGVSQDPNGRAPTFDLPEQILAGGREPYRIDSAHTHRARVASPTRSSDGRMLTAQVVDGQWRGGLYIYDEKHQSDDRRCIGWVKANLARAMLPAITPDLRCDVFRPAGYHEGVWRVRLIASSRVQAFWSGSPFLFALPELPYHRVDSEKANWADFGDGKLVDGAWLGDVYPNGSDGLKNPQSAENVRSAFMSSVRETFNRAKFAA